MKVWNNFVFIFSCPLFDFHPLFFSSFIFFT